MKLGWAADGIAFVLEVGERELNAFEVGLLATLEALDEWEFQTRTGIEPDEWRRISDHFVAERGDLENSRLGERASDLDAAPEAASLPEGASEFRMELRRAAEGEDFAVELNVPALSALVSGMSETLEGFRGEKFVKRTGFELDEWRRILRGPPRS